MRRKDMRELLQAAGVFFVTDKNKKDMAAVFSQSKEKAKDLLRDVAEEYRVTDGKTALAARYAKKIHALKPYMHREGIKIYTEEAVFRRGEGFYTFMPFNYHGEKYAYTETAEGARIEKTAQT